MQDRLRRFRRLIAAATGQERALGEEVARLQASCRQFDARLAALQPGPPEPGVRTAAEMAHRQRYRQQAERLRGELQAERLGVEREWRVGRRRLTEMAQTRRALQQFAGRLERSEELAQRRLEQQALDEHAQARGAR